jgi:type II secretory pathway component GspD/PulD (secretin)
MLIHKFILCFILLFITTAIGSAEQQLYAPPALGAKSLKLGEPVIDELALKDAEISEAIELIAQKSGLSIVTGQNVAGKVTVFLKHVDAREALRIVLESNGLAFAEESGIVRVMSSAEFTAKYGHAFGQDTVSKLIKLNVLRPQDAQKFLEEMKGPQGKVIISEEARTVLLVDNSAKVRTMEAFLAELDVPVMTLTLELKNARADSVLADVRRMLTPGVGAIEANALTNSLIVTDTVAHVEKVRKAVEVMDAHGRVMVLEAKLLHIVLNDEHAGGVDWTGIVEDHQRMRLVGRYDFLAGSDNGRALGFGMILNEDFPTLVEALDTVGIVQEYPLSTLRLSGDQQARLTVRFDDPSVDITLFEPGGPADENDLSVGQGASLVFTLKPSFDVTGDITTSVEPVEIRPLTKNLSHGTRALTLSAHEGYTAIIGGMIVSERLSPAHKIPLLGDLPVLGFAFRIDGTVRKEEFVVFLTPKSVSLSQLLADESPLADTALTGGE